MAIKLLDQQNEMEQKLVKYAAALIQNPHSSHEDSGLSYHRAEIYRSYKGDRLGNEHPQRSKVVSKDVMEMVEWSMPPMMKVFSSPESLVKFRPDGPEDVENAKQATAYVNYVFSRKNNGYDIIYDQIKSGLLNRRGIVEARYDDVIDVEPFDIEELSPQEYETLTQDPNVEIEEADVEVLDDQSELFPGNDEPIRYQNIVGKRHISRGKIVVETVPSEEFIVNEDAVSLEDAAFVGRERELSLLEIRELARDHNIEKKDFGDRGSPEMDVQSNKIYEKEELYARLDARGAYTTAFPSQSNEGAGYDNEELIDHKYKVYDVYIRFDFDDDGVPELRRVAFTNDILIINEQVAQHGYVSWSPIPVPHLYEGFSPADWILDIQKIKTALLRNVMDNAYNIAHGRYRVTRGEVDLGALYNGTPGSAVMTDGPDSISRLDTPALPDSIVGLVKYMDEVKSERVGLDRTSKGQNEGALRSNVASSSVSQVMAAGTSRMELMAQLYAQRALKPLFYKIFNLCKIFIKEDHISDLEDNWTAVSPSEWGNLKEVYVDINLNNINKEQMLTRLGGFFEMYRTIMDSNYGKQLVSPHNLYSLGMAYAKALGIQNYQDLLSDPSAPQQQGPQGQGEQQQAPDPEMIKAQAEAQAKQVDAQIKMAELQLKQQELMLKEKELQIKLIEIQADVEESEIQNAIKFEELETEKEQNRDVQLSSNRSS